METTKKQEVVEERGTAKIPLERLVMHGIDSIPRDGRKIVVFWKTPNDDITEFNVRECHYENFAYLGKERAKEHTPQWKFTTDNNYVMSIKEEEILGWLPCPKW